MKQILFTSVVYLAAALAEIAGCFAFWAWLKAGKSVWWLLPGVVALIAFAWLLSLVPTNHAGRAYAAYGGVYIASSVFWLWKIEGQVPDKWDMTGVVLALAAAFIIVFAPRGIENG